jgi:hypothetical protein
MITGSFISQLGTVTVELDDGISPNINFDIATVGALTYDFDQTPDSVSIDKVQALYNYFDISAPAFNREGVDIWSRLTTATQFGGQIRASVTIGEFSFGFRLRNPELSFDERSRIVKMRLIPFVDTGVEASTVFNALSGASFPVSVQGNVYQLPGVSVLDWIGEALRRIFGNNSPNIILPSKIGLDNDDYPSDLFGLASAGQRSFVMLNMSDNEFQEIEDGAQEFFPTGTISYPRFIDPPDTMEVTGVGTSFDTQLRRFDIIFINGNRLGTVLNDPTSATLFVMRVDKGNTLNEVREESFTILRPILPSRIPVINSLKDLAGAEGSIFGTGFSRNFYVNRLRKEGVTRVTLDWTKIIDFAPSTYYLSLGRSFVAQRASKDREGAGVYGRWPRRPITSDGEARESFLPNLTEFESITTGNPGGTKGLEIGLAPAYPHLNKVFRLPLGNSLFTDSSTTVLESALTRTGLTSYFQALNNTAGGLMVEFSILGAFSLKPWDIFQFDTRAPEKYQHRQWRITSIAYDIINNVARVKAYQIDDIRTPVFADNPISFGINASFGQGLLPKGLFSSVQAQIGEAIGDVQDVLFVTARNYSGTITELLVNKAGDFDEADFPGGIIALKGWPVKVMNSITLETFDAVLAEDLKVVDRVVKIEPLDLGLNTLVAGSYLYVSERQILAGIITGDFAVRIFAESSSIGVLRQPVSGLTESLHVRLFAPVIAGQDFVLQSIGGQPYYLTVSVSADVGATELDIRDAGGAGQFVEAPAGAFLIADGRFNRASINVDPGRVQIGVEAEREANGIAVTTAPINAGAVISIPVTNAQTLTLRDGDHLIVTDRTGAFVDLTVTGEQSVTSGTTVINASGTATADIGAGAQVAQPAWNQTGEINVSAGQVVLKAEETSGQITKLALVRLDANVAGGSAILLQADQITLDGQTVFINSLKSEGFVTDDDLPTTFGNITISAPNAPTARPDTTPLQPGDRWLDTDNGDLPHVWANVPPEWVREYTVIDGGNITTGTIDAQVVTVTNLNADNITTGTLNADRLNITAIIEDNDLATEGFVGDQVTPVADNAVRVFRQTTAPTASDRTDATIRSGDIWYKTNEGDLPHTYDGTTPFNVNGWIRAYTVIDGGNITTGTLDANRIVAGSITATELGTDSVTTVKIQASAIDTDRLAAGAVVASKIQGGTITANEIASATITGDRLVAGTITATQIATGTITATEIASATITGDKLVAGTITATQIDVTNLFAQQIQITSTGYIQSGNYSPGATGFRINADGNAEFRQVTVDGVIIAKADSNIDWQYVTAVSVSTAQIGDAQITNAKINDLDAVKINAGFLNAARIEAGSLNADKITAGTITATQLATNSVTADKIDVTNLQAVSANMGALNVDGVLTFSDTGSIISSKARPGGGDFVTVINNNGYNLTEEITASNVRGIDLGIGGILVTKTVSAVTTQVFIEPEGITSPSVQSAYKSADGTAGLTETIVFNDSVTNETNTVTIKNGLITAWTQIV